MPLVADAKRTSNARCSFDCVLRSTANPSRPSKRRPVAESSRMAETFEQGLSGELLGSHNVVVEQPVTEAEEKTLDDVRMSSEEETADLPLFAEMCK